MSCKHDRSRDKRKRKLGFALVTRIKNKLKTWKRKYNNKNRYVTFNVQGSMHCKYIPFDRFPTRCNITRFIYSWKTALHVSGVISTHHQEHTQLYLQYMVLVKHYCYLQLFWKCGNWFECGVGIVLIYRSIQFPHHTQTSSNPSTIAAGSSKDLTNTRYCKYSCVCSWWWVEIPPSTCRAVFQK